MSWKATFSFDQKNDVVTARFNEVLLQNAADVERWRQLVEGHISVYGRKVDLLIDLSGLVVKSSAGRLFGVVRAAVLAKYTNRSFRFGGDQRTQMFIQTSAVLDGTASNIYATEADALAALLKDRTK